MEKIGKYEVVRRIGSGGFGAVYEGRDPYIKRRVAIKTCGAEDAETRQRFLREAEIVGKLEHRNVTAVYDFGYADSGVPYLVQEYLGGVDLGERIASGSPLPTARKLDILLQVARGLDYAHRQGVIHRDVKPANIRVLEDGRVKLMDFGVALLANVESRLTKTGITLGTAAYLPPEQIRGETIDARADIFSFGVLAYELLAGQRPFGGRRLSEVMAAILHAEPPALVQALPECPAALATVVHRCLEKDPAARYPAMAAVIEALEPILASCEALEEMAEPWATAALPTRVMGPEEVARLERGAGQRRERQAETLLERARAKMRPGGWELATLALHEALALLPGHPDATQLLAEARAAQAAEAAERARASERARAAVRVSALLDRGELEAAATALAAAEHASGDVEAFADLGRRLETLRRRQREERVVTLLDQARQATAADDLTLAARLLEEAREADVENQDVERLLEEAHEALRQRAAQRRLEETQPGILIVETEPDAPPVPEEAPADPPPEVLSPLDATPLPRPAAPVAVTAPLAAAPAAPRPGGAGRGLLLGFGGGVVLLGLVALAAWLLLGARVSAPPPPPPPVAAPPRPSAPPTTGRVTLPPAALEGATVAIDGGAPALLAQGLVLQLPPGEHRLVFAAPGYRSAELVEVVAAGQDVRLEGPELVAEPRPAHRRAPPPPPPPEPAPPAPAVAEVAPPPPPPAVQRGDLVEPGPGVVPPRRIQVPAARPPQLPRRQRQDASVVVAVLVDENGAVIDARVEQAGPAGLGFDEAALEAARQATFRPATKDGVEVKIWERIRFGFRLR